MAEPPCTLNVPPLDTTMGALFIGVSAAGALWGITSMQTYNYFLVRKLFRLLIKVTHLTIS
ncbi:hypothetical protein MPER_03684 [Moniliophthora perniciosa FA553]|nr:hypothetical protein MPER_03684 [Moniliophthora perniciosa FA553]